MESVLIKLSGNFLSNSQDFDYKKLRDFVEQIKQLSKIFKIGIVVGGGNFFRAAKQGKQLNMKQTHADYVGMLATIMNGLILSDLLQQVNLNPVVLSAFKIDTIVTPISQQTIDTALSENKILIFVGGTGNPFFTTDTNAVLRALQMGAKQVWKATKVDGVYSADPAENKNAEKFPRLEYKNVLEQNLKIIDSTAITLAADNKVLFRVFNIFEKDALIKVAQDIDFGSTIS
jgi:uridylate kinase